MYMYMCVNMCGGQRQSVGLCLLSFQGCWGGEGRVLRSRTWVIKLGGKYHFTSSPILYHVYFTTNRDLKKKM